MFDLTGKVALVAGGAGYLGSPVCRALAGQGAAVVIADMAVERAQALAAAISEEMPQASVHALCLDGGDEASIRAMVADTVARCGGLHIFVNATYKSIGKAVDDLSVPEFDASLHVQVSCGFLMAREAAAAMTGGGSIVFFSSMYGQVSPDPRVYHPPMLPNPIEYGAGKAAIIQMTKYLAVAWAPRGIRVNAVAPGPFPFPSLQQEEPAFSERLAQKTPMRRVGLRHELAGPVVFLASDEASYVTGETLSVNGGWTSW